MFSFLSKEKIKELPSSPGVYRFDDKDNKIIYIGKAINLKNRVRSHFKQPSYRDNLFMGQVQRVGYQQTPSEVEALILEAQLIKENLPKYNVLWRDGRNYLYVEFTREKLPFVLVTHQTKPKTGLIGPFVDGKSLKSTLRLLRRAFPYYTKKHPAKLCPDCFLGLCPGPDPDLREYRKNIQGLKQVLRGKRKGLLRGLKREMTKLSQEQEFEKAAQKRNQIFALESVFDNARVFTRTTSWSETEKDLQRAAGLRKSITRLEAYDVANLQGQSATGSMVVFRKDAPNKSQYRRFRIRLGEKPNDVAMIKETLRRRLDHSEWPYPDIILIDGGKAQLNAALEVLNQHQSAKSASISVMALAKRNNELFVEGKDSPLLLKNLSRPVFNLILQLRDEAHRFARTYHFYLRKKRVFG